MSDSSEGASFGLDDDSSIDISTASSTNIETGPGITAETDPGITTEEIVDLPGITTEDIVDLPEITRGNDDLHSDTSSEDKNYEVESERSEQTRDSEDSEYNEIMGGSAAPDFTLSDQLASLPPMVEDMRPEKEKTPFDIGPEVEEVIEEEVQDDDFLKKLKSRQDEILADAMRIQYEAERREAEVEEEVIEDMVQEEDKVIEAKTPKKAEKTRSSGDDSDGSSSSSSSSDSSSSSSSSSEDDSDNEKPPNKESKPQVSPATAKEEPFSPISPRKQKLKSLRQEQPKSPFSPAKEQSKRQGSPRKSPGGIVYGIPPESDQESSTIDSSDELRDSNILDKKIEKVQKMMNKEEDKNRRDSKLYKRLSEKLSQYESELSGEGPVGKPTSPGKRASSPLKKVQSPGKSPGKRSPGKKVQSPLKKSPMSKIPFLTSSDDSSENSFLPPRKPSSLPNVSSAGLKKVSFDVEKEGDDDDDDESFETYYSSEDEGGGEYDDDYDDNEYGDEDYDDDDSYETYESDEDDETDSSYYRAMDAYIAAGGEPPDNYKKKEKWSDTESEKKRGSPRKSFKNIPKSLELEINSIHSIDEEGESKKRKGFLARLFGLFSSKNDYKEMNENRNKPVDVKRSDRLPKSERLGKPNDELSEYDDISQVTDRNFGGQKPARPSARDLGSSRSLRSQRSVRNTKRALESLEPLSIRKPEKEGNVRPEDSWIPSTMWSKEKRNTKTACEGLDPLSIRKYESMLRKTKRKRPEKVPLADMKALSVGLQGNYSLGSKSKDSVDTDIESGTRVPRKTGSKRSKGSKSTKSDGSRTSKSSKGSRSSKSSTSNGSRGSIPRRIYQIEEVIEEEFVEDEEALSIQHGSPEPDGAYYGWRHLPGSLRFKKPSVAPRSKNPEDRSLFARRSRLYCWFVLFGLIVLGVGLWLLLEYLVLDEDQGILPVFPTKSPVTFPTPTMTQAPSSPINPTTFPSSFSTLSEREELIKILEPFLPDDGQGFDEMFSPQSRALDWLLQNALLSSYDTEKIVTRFALAVFYFSTDGDNWAENRGWLSDTDECNWYAASLVTPCNLDGRYSSLVLGDNNIRGTLPAELSMLSNSLTKVDLGGTMTGVIPNEYGYLTRLQSLRLQGKGVSGGIPANFSRLKALTDLELSRNSLSGTIAPQLFKSLTNLEVLDLGNNKFSGQISSEISYADKLTELSLEDNNLRGTIPSQIANLGKLKALRLDNNGFTTLPREIGFLANLQLLSIRHNDIGGTLPTELGGLKSLKGLFLDNNSFRSTIPTEVGWLTNLSDGLDLSRNFLTGQVPSEMGLLTNLSEFDG